MDRDDLKMTPEEKNIYETVVIIDKDGVYKRIGCPSLSEGYSMYEKLMKGYKLKKGKEIFLIGS